MYEEDPSDSSTGFAGWGLIDVKTDSQLFEKELSGEAEWAEESIPLLCVLCNLEFVSYSQFLCHHLEHVSSPSVVLPQLSQRQHRRLLAGKPVKKRPGPRSKTEGLVPVTVHSPIKLTIKRLSTCHEPAFEVVYKKKVKKLAAMDEMIPGGLEENQIPSFPQFSSTSPSDILRQEVPADSDRCWENIAFSFGFLAPEPPPEAAQEAEPTVNGELHPPPEPEDKSCEEPRNDDPEPPLSSPSEPPILSENGLTNCEPQKGARQESPDSGCEKDSSEKDFTGFDSNPDRTPPPPPSNPSPIGSLTIRAPSDVNSSISIVNGSLPPEPMDSTTVSEALEPPVPAAIPPVKEGLIIKSLAELGATSQSSVNLILTDIPMRNYMEPDFLQTCEVCGDRCGNLEQHKAQLGHYKCLISPECTTVFATELEFSTHQQIAHGIAPPPNHQSLQQLQQQVQRLPLPFGVPAGITLSYPPTPGSAAASPTLTSTPPLPGGIQARPFALATSPSTMRPDGSPVASPALPTGLGRSISISPSVKPGQKRATPAAPIVETTTSKKSRAESPDCELVDVQQPIPALPSGISLTVRGSNDSPRNKDSSGVANILASRGITVTPATTKSPAPPPPRANNSPQPITSLNLGSAVSIVPASQSRGRSVSRQPVASQVRTPTVDLTQDNDRPVFNRRNRPQRFTCQVCDKVFTSQETLNQHLTTHRSPGKLPHKCNLCNAQYPTQQGLLQHKQTYHKEAQGSEMALPVVDLKAPSTIQKLTQLGIRHCLILSQLSNSSGGVYGLPIVALDNVRNPAIGNLAALGASNVLSMGPAKALR